ncbi:uncharacterized protein LOC143187061 [Calliopsis andreniformis]|uniref:uncharacterized protein LOC143187061 n=1 Tax=Calliopsis andreniformis TaxID=337506 RepID=UPI003FCD311F
MYVKYMDPNELLKELQTCTMDTVIFRKLINYASSCKQSWNDDSLKEWQPVLIYIVQIFIPSTEVTRERALLASHTFFALLSMQPTLLFLKNTFNNFLRSNTNDLYFLDTKYDTVEPELFKLLCSHGYLQVNQKEIYSNDVCLLIFDVIYEYCIKYTKYSYFAYKILYMWLNRTMNTNFWDTCDSITEQKLEAIIFSNWCNAINEISKQNSLSVFNLYLKIMEKKYSGYLGFLYKHCIDNISWTNELKYDIFAEICTVWNNVPAMTSHDFLFPLCITLTKYNLRSAGTKVYIAIIKKLNEDEWKQSFGCIMNYLFHSWEMENETHGALQFLCKHWFEPIIKKYKNILLYLWNLTTDINGHFLRSHLQKMASEMNIDLPHEPKIEFYLSHSKEIVRLNGFAIYCYQIKKIFNKNRDCFNIIKDLLWHNANSTSVHMRDGIVKYLKVFYANILKMCDTETNYADDVYHITYWLHEFLLDCFEIGSCYQRKILGLNLYRAMLSFTNANVFNKSNNIENVSCTLLLQKHLKASGKWEFTSKKSLFYLLRLVLDSALDVKQLATSIILEYFDKDTLTNAEKQTLYKVALQNCNSSKFYEIESGAVVLSILANWLPLHTLQSTSNKYTKYSDFLLNEASSQLTHMKEDILKAIVHNTPFYGVLTALLNTTFRNGPESNCITLEFMQKTLHLLKNGVDFFLSVLSSKSENREYSSSFAEMGLAIDEVIKNSEIDTVNFDELNLTPAHQVLISCIWMSLKVSCEIACEIGTLMHSDEIVKSSVNIIITVLLKCRHKGAVEAAGSSIGHLTRYLCKEAEYCNMLKLHVVHILENDDMHLLNITRRGAGLSIMFHKIVVNDNRRDRPLLHFAVQKLLNSLEDFPDDVLQNFEAQHDSPWARRLHFLRALVSDKEIHAHLIPYIERISLTCFKYLKSEIWTIRNASLQLFGAIVSRLVGQTYDEALDFGNGYPINHFVTHYPVLANHVMKELHNFSFTFTNFSTALYLHSNIVHILILLSKFSNSGCDLIEYSAQKFVPRVRHVLRTLFKNPILYIRLLAAKAYAALTDVLSIKSEIKKLKCDVLLSQDANLIHGHLLTMKYLKEKLSVEEKYMHSCTDIAECTTYESRECMELLQLRKILQIWNTMPEKNNPQICYLIQALFLELSESIPNQICVTDIFPIDQNISVLSSEKIKPGFFKYIDICTKLYVDYMKRTNNVNTDILHKILDSYCIDQSISFLNYLWPSVSALKIVLERLLLYEHNCNELLLNTMTNYALRTFKDLPLTDLDELSTETVLDNLSVQIEKSVTYTSLWRLKCIVILIFSKNEILIDKILSLVLGLCIHKEEHMRQIAAEFLQFSVRRFTKLINKNQLIILYCCLILLKDDISEISEIIAESLRTYVLQTINSEYTFLGHTEHIYQELLSHVMLNRSKFFLGKDISLFFIKLFTHNIKNFDVNVIIENPFYHDDNPFYREESKFLNLCFYYIQQNKYSRNKCSTKITVEYNNENVIDSLGKIEAKYQLQEKCSFEYTNLETVLNTKYLEYLSKKQRIVMQEYS